jgi:hypothetical protein
MTGRWTGTLFVMQSPNQGSIQFVVWSQIRARFQATVSDPDGGGPVAETGRVTRAGKMKFTARWRDTRADLTCRLKLTGMFYAGDGTSTVDMINSANFQAKRGRATLDGWFYLRRDPPPAPAGAAG